MKKTKKIVLSSAIVATIATSVVTSLCINQNLNHQNIIKTNNNEQSTLMNQKSSIDYLQGNYIVDFDTNAITYNDEYSSLANGIYHDSTNRTKAVTPNGYVFTSNANDGTISNILTFIDAITGKIRWNVKLDQGMRIINVAYSEIANAIICISCYDNGYNETVFNLKLFNEWGGQTQDFGNFLTIKNDNKKKLMAETSIFVPIRYNQSGLDEFIFIPGGYWFWKTRNEYVKKISFNYQGINGVETCNNFMTYGAKKTWHAILGVGAFYNHHNKLCMFTIEQFDDKNGKDAQIMMFMYVDGNRIFGGDSDRQIKIKVGSSSFSKWDKRYFEQQPILPVDVMDYTGTNKNIEKVYTSEMLLTFIPSTTRIISVAGIFDETSKSYYNYYKLVNNSDLTNRFNVISSFLHNNVYYIYTDKNAFESNDQDVVLSINVKNSVSIKNDKYVHNFIDPTNGLVINEIAILNNYHRANAVSINNQYLSNNVTHEIVLPNYYNAPEFNPTSNMIISDQLNGAIFISPQTPNHSYSYTLGLTKTSFNAINHEGVDPIKALENLENYVDKQQVLSSISARTNQSNIISIEPLSMSEQTKINDGIVLFKVRLSNVFVDGLLQENYLVQQDLSLSGFKILNTDFIDSEPIKWSDSNFSTTPDERGCIIFANDKGFSIDWKSLSSSAIAEKELSLTNYLNVWKDRYFNVNVNDENIKVNYTKFSAVINNEVSVEINYQGYENGILKSNLKGFTKIILRDFNPSDVNNSLFNNWSDFINQKINDAKQWVDNEQFRGFVSEYLTTNINNIPDVYLDKKVINYQAIRLSFEELDISTNPINIQEAMIQYIPTDNSLSPIIFPTTSININFITEVIETIPITGELASWTAKEIVDNFNQSSTQTIIFNKLYAWIEQNQSSIFKNYSQLTIQNFKIININYQQDTLILEFSLEDAQTINGIKPMTFVLNITNFLNNNNQNNTYLTLKIIDASDPLFKHIFSDDKGFSIDWNNQILVQKANMLKSYLNTHIQDYFVNYMTPTNQTYVSSILINPVAQDQTTAIVSFSGLKDGIFTNNLTQEILINLKPTPIDNEDTTNNLFSALRQYLQTWVDKNKYFPNNFQLQTIIVDYLNQNQELIPNIWIPDTNQFNLHDVVINSESIQSIDRVSNVIIMDGAITINFNTTTISMNQFEINVPITNLKQEQIEITGELSNLYASEIVNNHQNSFILTNWIQEHLEDIFDNVDISTMQVINPTYALISNQNSLNVTITLTNAYDTNQIKNLTFNFIIYGFNNNGINQQTSLKIKTLNHQDANFNVLLGSNDKGFAIDWKDQLASKTEIILKNINNNINLFFQNPMQTKVNNVTLSLKNEQVNAKLNYSGLKSDGTYGNIEQTLVINLRPTPTTQDLNVDNILESWILNNPIPSNNQLQQIVLNMINQDLKNYPDAWIPKSRQFSSNNIVIDGQKITRTEQSIKGDIGAIKLIDKNNQSHEFNSFDVSKNTSINVSQEKSSWDAWIKYLVIAIVSGFGIILIILLLTYIMKRRNQKSTIDYF